MRNDIRRRKVGLAEAECFGWRAERIQGRPDPSGILRSSFDPEVQIASDARHSVRSQCVGSNDQESGTGIAQGPDHVAKIVGHEPWVELT